MTDGNTLLQNLFELLCIISAAIVWFGFMWAKWTSEPRDQDDVGFAIFFDDDRVT